MRQFTSYYSSVFLTTLVLYSFLEELASQEQFLPEVAVQKDALSYEDGESSAEVGRRVLPQGSSSKINANESGYWIDGVFSPWKKASSLSISATHLATPRTVLGGGDIKLMAMLGAFLGADATIHILLWGALFGCLYAFLRFPFKKLSLKTQIPFGPFLALSALLWLMAGNLCYKLSIFLTK